MAFNNPVQTVLGHNSVESSDVIETTLYSLQLTIEYLQLRITGSTHEEAKELLEPEKEKRRFLMIGVKEVDGLLVLNMRAAINKTFILLDNKLVWADLSYGDSKRPAVESLEEALQFYEYMHAELKKKDQEFIDFLNTKPAMKPRKKAA